MARRSERVPCLGVRRTDCPVSCSNYWMSHDRIESAMARRNEDRAAIVARWRKAIALPGFVWFTRTFRPIVWRQCVQNKSEQ
ncbi:hypothetical protein KJZ67_05320 [Patescibacteria group bacterium]|nr:hypothetical protein [Patescibacteria group bacterium]